MTGTFQHSIRALFIGLSCCISCNALAGISQTKIDCYKSALDRVYNDRPSQFDREYTVINPSTNEKTQVILERGDLYHSGTIIINDDERTAIRTNRYDRGTDDPVRERRLRDLTANCTPA